MGDKRTCKARIEYPCQWLYKVIGPDREKLRQALLDTVAAGSCKITLSNSSSSGQYHCFNIEVAVKDEEERNAIYRALKGHPLVKVVL